MAPVEVDSVEDDGFFSDGRVSGSCVKVTLRRDDTFVSCEQILIWEEEDDEYMQAVFDEWLAYAKSGEEGYKTWTE